MDELEDMRLESFGATATVPPVMTSRPFEVFNDRKTGKDMLDVIDLDGIRETLDTSITREISTSLVSKLINKNALMPAKRGIDLNLPNGDESKRLAFMLITSTPKASGIMFTYIQGYTDKYEVDNRYGDNGELADDTIFFINRITSVVETEDEHGNIYYNTLPPLEVVHNRHTGAYEYENEYDDIDSLSRASDIMLDITASRGGMRTKKQNLVNKVQDEGKLTRSDQKTGAGLLSDVINNYNVNVSSRGMDDINTLYSSVSLLRETASNTIPFLAALDNLRETIRASMSSAPVDFTFRELRTIFREVNEDGFGIIIEADDDAINEKYESLIDYEEDGMDRDSDTVVLVTDLMNVVMDKMSGYGIKSIGFTITNFDSERGDIDISFMDGYAPIFAIKGIDRELARGRIQKFFREIKEEFFLPASENGARALLFSVAMEEDFVGKIVIEGDGVERGIYPVNPSITSITTPLLTSTNKFDKLTDTVHDLLQNI